MSIHYLTIVEVGAPILSSLASAIAAFGAWRVAHDTRKIADKTSVATESQAQSSKDSAQAAASSLKAAQVVTKLELDHRHDVMAPKIEFRLRWQAVPMFEDEHQLVADICNLGAYDYEVSPLKRWAKSSPEKPSDFTLLAQQTHVMPIGTSAQIREGYLQCDLVLGFEAVEPCPCERKTQPQHHWTRHYAIDDTTWPPQPPARNTSE